WPPSAHRPKENRPPSTSDRERPSALPRRERARAVSQLQRAAPQAHAVHSHGPINRGNKARDQEQGREPARDGQRPDCLPPASVSRANAAPPPPHSPPTPSAPPASSGTPPSPAARRTP